ncbi:MAG: precorrin-6y C5,15-methyltransferase (decarboxylating) subunit CbiE [Chloroflexales bacterium]|nr:precorrin-6y C5,15-methyltransferase (decarboxylating) subunit CbiE [Chloroflexales bacterium]
MTCAEGGTPQTPKILVLGVTGAGCEHLPAAQIARVQGADLLVGGDRQLAWFPEFSGERLSLRQGLAVAAQRLRQALEAGQRAVVLASGDPLCYGVGASLRRWFAADELEIVPAPSAYQLAFAALGEPWHDAALLSAHGRPLAEVIRSVAGATKAAILTDDQHTPAVIAQALLAAGLPAASPCAICENLAEAAQRVVRATLAEAAEQTFAALNVFVVWPAAEFTTHSSQFSTAPGLPDDAFSTTGGLITKREIRLLILAELAPRSGEVLWDLGAGSGAVGIELARWQPAATVYAVERRTELCAHIRENLRRFPAPNLHLTEGTAPAACADLPDPHAVFIGGSGGQLAPLIALVRRRLAPGGRLVLALVTLEHLQAARDCLPAARVVQVQVSVGAPIQRMLRLEAQNPVFLLTWWNNDEHNPPADGGGPGAG